MKVPRLPFFETYLGLQTAIRLCQGVADSSSCKRLGDTLLLHSKADSVSNFSPIVIAICFYCRVSETSKLELISTIHLSACPQMRNYLVALFLSQGVPVLTMGDEYGHTKNGNLDVEDRCGPAVSHPQAHPGYFLLPPRFITCTFSLVREAP